MRRFQMKVYTNFNQEFIYFVRAHDWNKPREHAKRIVMEGYWHQSDEREETFYSPNTIVKVKINEEV